MAMVMPRSFSSGALSIWSKGVKSAMPFSDRTLVMAAVSVVLPWSMCPIVPMFTWGFVRSNFFLAISSSSLLAGHPGDDLLRDLRGDLVVRVQLHGAVGGAALGAGPELRGVAEELGERHQDADGLLTAALVDALDAAAARRDVAHHVAEELLGRRDLELHDALEQHGVGLLGPLLHRHR